VGNFVKRALLWKMAKGRTPHFFVATWILYKP